MAALLDDAAARDDGDLVGVLDGGEAVGDHQRGAALAQLVQRALDHDLGGVVKRRGGLVQDEYGRVLEEHAGDGQALLLPARQAHAALADHGVVAVLHGEDVVVDVGALGGLDDLLLGGVETPVEYVVADGGVEQVDVLLHDAHVAAQRLERDAVDLLAVDEQLARGDVVEVGDQVAQRGLAASRRAHQRKGLALGDVEADVVQHLVLAVAGIAVGDVAQLDVALHALDVLRALAVALGLLVDDLQEALKAGDAVLVLLHEVDEGIDGV